MRAKPARLVAPHGGELVDRSGERPERVERLEALEVPRALAGPVDQLPAVRRDEPGFGRDRHTRTSP